MVIFKKLSYAGRLLVLVLLAAITAHAEPSPADKAAAEALFIQGRKQFGAGKYTEACKSFSDSNQLDPGVGTLQNLAACYEKQGRTASAWTTYRDAISAAHQAHQTDREKSLREAIQALEPKLAKLTVVVAADPQAPDLQIKRDGHEVLRPMWGLAVPIDPGSYVLVASAPGRKEWRSQVVVEGGKTTSVTVPVLEKGEPAKPPSSAKPTEVATVKSQDAATTQSSPGAGNTQRIVAGVVGGVGIVATGIGAYFGVRAHSTYNNADCDPDNGCSQQGLDDRNRGASYGRTSTILITGGLVAVATGAILWFTAPTSKSATDAMRSPPDNRRFTVSAQPLGDTRTVTLSGTF